MSIEDFPTLCGIVRAVQDELIKCGRTPPDRFEVSEDQWHEGYAQMRDYNLARGLPLDLAIPYGTDRIDATNFLVLGIPITVGLPR